VTTTSDLGMQIIREALESYLEPKMAALIVFGALQGQPDENLPQTAEGLMDFARGALALELTRRVGQAEATVVVSNLQAILGAALGSASPPRRRERHRPSQAATHALPDGSGPVKIVVVARSRRLMNQLRAAIGAHLVAAAATSDLKTLEELRRSLGPDVVVIDGQDAADIRPPDLATAMADARGRPLVLIWASDQPWGNAVSRAFDEHGTPFAMIARTEGHEPLLDYVRSRSHG